jgi:hypothetical protein
MAAKTPKAFASRWPPYNRQTSDLFPQISERHFYFLLPTFYLLLSRPWNRFISSQSMARDAAMPITSCAPRFADRNASRIRMKITFFRSPSDFRKWLEQNHATTRELWVGYYKKNSGKPSITWPESVDEALCFGWIDGIRKSRHDLSYTIRFTPRKPKSNWSAINIRRWKLSNDERRKSPGFTLTKIGKPPCWTNPLRSSSAYRMSLGIFFKRKQRLTAKLQFGGW